MRPRRKGVSITLPRKKEKKNLRKQTSLEGIITPGYTVVNAGSFDTTVVL